MNRKQADIGVSVLILCILLLGVLSAVQLQLAGGPMSDEMDGTPVIATFGPLIMSLVVSSIVGGMYLFVRGQIFPPHADDSQEAGSRNGSNDVPELGGQSGHDDGSEIDGQWEPPDEIEAGETTGADGTVEPETPAPGTEKGSRVLDVLPDDERRILEPVIESPGLTQIKVRDRSGFSRSKVSQTVSDLEERGLLYREPQGRTYRVYPADDLHDRV